MTQAEVDRSTTVLSLALAVAAFVVSLAVVLSLLNGCGPAFRAADSIELPDSSDLPAVGNSPMLEASTLVGPTPEASALDAATDFPETSGEAASLDASEEADVLATIVLMQPLPPPNDAACYPTWTACQQSEWGTLGHCCQGRCAYACAGPVGLCCDCVVRTFTCVLPTDCCAGLQCVRGVCQ